MKRHIVERKLEQIILTEARDFRDLMTDVQNYELLTRIFEEEPESISEDELGAAKEAIMEGWPEVTDVDVALASTGSERLSQMHRLITEAKQLPRVRPDRQPSNETQEERAARLESELARLKQKYQERKIIN